MATVVTAKANPQTQNVQVPAAGPTALNAALAAAGGSYNQTAQQNLTDMVNDIRQLLINVGLAK